MSNYLSFPIRLDTSGIRGQGLKRPLKKASEKFPYDDKLGYGLPRKYMYGPSTTGGTSTGRYEITPKDIEHSVWDEIEEITGYPVLLGKSAGAGGQEGGRVMPGTSGEWSARPKAPWFDNQLDDEELDAVSELMMPPMRNSWSSNSSFVDKQFNDITDDELEQLVGPRKEDSLDGMDTFLVGGVGFGSSLGNRNKNNRNFPGFTWKESVQPPKLTEVFKKNIK